SKTRIDVAAAGLARWIEVQRSTLRYRIPIPVREGPGEGRRFHDTSRGPPPPPPPRGGGVRFSNARPRGPFSSHPPPSPSPHPPPADCRLSLSDSGAITTASLRLARTSYP